MVGDERVSWARAMTNPPRSDRFPRSASRSPLPALSRPAGQVVNLIILTSAALASPSGLFLMTATPVTTLPAIGLVIQTTSSTSGLIFFNVLFQGQLF